MPALWLKDEDRFDEAKKLLNSYQQQRSERIQQEYEDQRARGELPLLWQRIAAEPLTMLFYLLAILYISLTPFMGL